MENLQTIKKLGTAMKIWGIILEGLGHLALLVVVFFIGHGFDLFKDILPDFISSHKDFLDKIAFPLALFALSELVVYLFKKSKKNANELKQKIEELSFKKTEENITATINNQLSSIQNLIKDAIYNSYLREPNHLVDGFSDTIRHFLHPHSGELVEPISEFMQGSIASIMEHGFVKVNAGFDDYRIASTKMVESIYDSPNDNSIKMISVYSPLEYLHMNTVGKKIDIENGKPNHLLVFNGYRVIYQNNDEEKVFVEEIKEHTRGSTKRKRIVFLKKENFIKLLESTNDEAKARYIFSYLWFLTMNTEIELWWGWKEEFKNYWYDEKTTENGDVDFMIFNQKYFWRYNLDKKCLYISWDPLAQEVEGVELANQKILFGKSVDYFNKAKRIFNLPVTAEQKSPYSQDYSLAPSLPSLIKKEEEGLFEKYRTTLKIGIEHLKKNKDKFLTQNPYGADAIKINIFIETLNSFLDGNPNILESPLNDFEDGFIESFKGENLVPLYTYYFHPSFAVGIKKIFPDVANRSEIF